MGRLEANEAINQRTSVQIRLDETSGVWSPTQDRVSPRLDQAAQGYVQVGHETSPDGACAACPGPSWPWRGIFLIPTLTLPGLPFMPIVSCPPASNISMVGYRWLFVPCVCSPGWGTMIPWLFLHPDHPRASPKLTLAAPCLSCTGQHKREHIILMRCNKSRAERDSHLPWFSDSCCPCYHSSGAHHNLQGLSCPSTGAKRRLESLLRSSQCSIAHVEQCHLHVWAGQRRCPKEPRATRAAKHRINTWDKVERKLDRNL